MTRYSICKYYKKLLAKHKQKYKTDSSHIVHNTSITPPFIIRHAQTLLQLFTRPCLFTLACRIATLDHDGNFGYRNDEVPMRRCFYAVWADMQVIVIQ
jgi:hypothetical protein